MADQLLNPLHTQPDRAPRRLVRFTAGLAILTLPPAAAVAAYQATGSWPLAGLALAAAALVAGGIRAVLGGGIPRHPRP